MSAASEYARKATQSPGYEAPQPPAGTTEIDAALAEACQAKPVGNAPLDSKEGVKRFFVTTMRSRQAKAADKVRAATELGKIVGAYNYDTVGDLKKMPNDQFAQLLLEVYPPVKEIVDAELAKAERKLNATR